MLARQSVPVVGACVSSSSSDGQVFSGGDSNAPGEGQWTLSFGYRGMRSARHFVGTVEQHERQEEATAVVNKVHLFDVAVGYALTPRLTLTASVPIMFAKRKSGRTPDRVFHSNGIGDISLGARMWLIRPPSETRQNIAFGVGLKLPTGKPDVTNTFMTATGPITSVADQSIQLGDGGVGVVLTCRRTRP